MSYSRDVLSLFVLTVNTTQETLTPPLESGWWPQWRTPRRWHLGSLTAAPSAPSPAWGETKSQDMSCSAGHQSDVNCSWSWLTLIFITYNISMIHCDTVMHFSFSQSLVLFVWSHRNCRLLRSEGWTLKNITAMNWAVNHIQRTNHQLEHVKKCPLFFFCFSLTSETATQHDDSFPSPQHFT